MNVFVIESEQLEGQDIWTVARAVGPDGSTLVAADVSGTVTVKTYDVNAAGTVIYSKTDIAAAGVVLTALTTSGYWDKDDTGYNFIHRLTAANHAFEGGHTYRIEYSWTSSSWGLVNVFHRVSCISLSSVV